MTTQSAAAAKAALRAEIRARRRQRSASERQDAGLRLREVVMALPEVEAARVVTAYLDAHGEPPTMQLLAGLGSGQKKVLLPVQTADGQLDWAANADQASLGPHGIFEPDAPRLGVDAIADADVILVPALAADRHGHRLGQGGGAYDRALQRAGSAFTVAVIYPDEVLDQVPTEPHDIKVDAIATPLEVIRCSGE